MTVNSDNAAHGKMWVLLESFGLSILVLLAYFDAVRIAPTFVESFLK